MRADPEAYVRELLREPLAIMPEKADQIQLAIRRIAAGEFTAAELEVLAGSGPSEASSASGVAILPLMGTITQRSRYWGASLEQFMAYFEEAVADQEIGTIVIHADTPGGSVGGVFEASRRIFEARSKKRIIAVADPLMASAGYALGSAAHEIVVSPTSRSGSIGVISFHAEFSKMLAEAGIGVTIFTAGRFKGEGNPYEPLSDEAKQHFQETVDDYYLLFVEAITRNRGVGADEVMQGMGEARALTAERAVEAGLADRIATIDEVLAELGVRRRDPNGMRAERGIVPVGAELEAQEDPEDPEEDPEEDPDDEDEDKPEAAADAAGPDEPAEPTPEGEEWTMPKEHDGGPQDGAGTAAVLDEREVRSTEAKRSADIVTLASAHGMPERAANWISEGRSADWVGREILRLKSEEHEPVTPPQPEEERRSAAVIQRRHSSQEDEPGFEIGMRLLAMGARANAHRNSETLDPAAWLDDSGFPEIAAAMRSDRADAGGSWVPENYLAGEFIELLRPASAVRMLNPTYWPLTGGTATVPKLTGGATAYYKGEAQRGTKSEGTSGRVNLVAKQLMAFVPATTQLFRRATPSAAITMRDDAIAAVAQRSDLAFIRGDGTEDVPKGLRYLAPTANVIDANGTVNLANVTVDLGKLVLALENADVRMLRPGWIFAPRTKHYLMTVRDGNGNYAFRAEMLAGSLWGFPYATTSQIPTNLGSGSDESEVYFADFADVVVGEEENLRFDAFDQVTYWDGSAWISAAQNDEIVIRVIAEHDINMRHDASIAVLDAVTWGS